MGNNRLGRTVSPNMPEPADIAAPVTDRAEPRSSGWNTVALVTGLLGGVVVLLVSLYIAAWFLS